MSNRSYYYLSVSRFEGSDQDLVPMTAVLITGTGREVRYPRELLPLDVKAGDVLSFDVEIDSRRSHA